MLLRVKPALRRQIVKAARKSGRSLSAEINWQLVRSIEDEDWAYLIRRMNMPTKAGPYSKDDGKDRIRQGDKGDKPFGSPRQLNINMIHDHSEIGMGKETGGASRKLPKDFR